MCYLITLKGRLSSLEGVSGTIESLSAGSGQLLWELLGWYLPPVLPLQLANIEKDIEYSGPPSVLMDESGQLWVVGGEGHRVRVES